MGGHRTVCVRSKLLNSLMCLAHFTDQLRRIQKVRMARRFVGKSMCVWIDLLHYYTTFDKATHNRCFSDLRGYFMFRN